MTGLRLWLALAGVLAHVPISSKAAEWSAPQPVFRSNGHVRGPFEVTDSSGALHLFFVEDPADSGTPRLVYLRRDPTGWSKPVTVVDPGGRLESPAAVVDAHGWLQLVYAGLDWAQLEYQRVPVSQIADPSAWSRPQAVSDAGVFHSDLVATHDGLLHLAYASRTGDIFYRRSDDDGRSWSDAVAVSAVDPKQAAADAPNMTIDDRGRVHVVWTQFQLPAGWPPTGAFYSRSEDGGRTWRAPREMAGLNRGEIAIASWGNDEVHVAWNALVAIGDREHAWSLDGGATWSAPERITTKVRGGWTGMPGLVFDSGGTLHEVTSVDGPERVERVVHLTRTGARWSDPELTSGGEQAQHSVEFPALALGGGNHLHVAYEVDYQQIWYTEQVTDAPVIAPRPVPTVATDLRARFAEASLPLRALLIVLAALIVSMPIEVAWRHVAQAVR